MTASELKARDARSLWHPYTQHQLVPATTPVVRAEGAYLIAADGHRILDCISSWWVTLHGHSHPVVARAIAQQAMKLEQVIFAGFTHEPAIELAEQLLRIAPRGLKRVFYTDDGSTAVEVAIKMALQLWKNRGEKRHLIVALDNAYHGDTFGAMSVSARGPFTGAFAEKLFDVFRLSDPVDGDPAAEFRQLLDRRGREVAAIIVEPLLLGAGGMRVWSADRLRTLRNLAADAGVLFIADEVLTGFGRTSSTHLFACSSAGIEPDILCLSKGITGGFLPLGATLANEEVFQAFLHHDRMAGFTLYHGHSYTANPIACAASVASISLLDERCARKRAAIESVHCARIERIRQRENICNARILGTLAAFDIIEDNSRTGYLSNAAAQVARFCLANGVFIRPLGNVVYLLPPYDIAPGDLERAYDVIEEALSASE